MVCQIVLTNLVDIVSSRVKAELLRLLFGLRQPELHLRELVRQSGLSLGTVQQELRRLTRIGLVTARRDGNRVYYQADQEHPLYADLRNVVLKTNGLVNVLRQALQVKDVQLAFVFGSIARGEARPESDVDLMVITPLGLRGVARLLSGVGEKLGRQINPHVLAREEFSRRKGSGDHFVSSVLASPKLFAIGSEHELAAMGQ
jgi:predicted nucleotidyltransferase/DNA-binding HxlR family transcriptional regulator